MRDKHESIASYFIIEFKCLPPFHSREQNFYYLAVKVHLNMFKLIKSYLLNIGYSFFIVLPLTFGNT